MTGCHNCGHAAAIAAGKYAERDWDDVPCSTCDVMRGADFPFPYFERAEVVEPDVVPDPEAERLPLSVMQEVVLGLLSLPAALRDVVAWRHAGLSYGQIAMAQGVTPQCAEKRHRRALEQWPALRELFPEKRVRVKTGTGG